MTPPTVAENAAPSSAATSTPSGSSSPSSSASSSSTGNVTSGTASDALLKAVAASEAAEGASSSSSAPAAKPAGDTSAAASAPAGGPTAASAQSAAEVKPVETGTAGARDPQLEARFQNVARNAQTKVLSALGLEGVSFDQLKNVGTEIKTAMGILAELRRDPRAFVQQLTTELSSSGGVEEFKWPDPALRSEDGKGAYTADQLKEIVAGVKKSLTQELLGSRELQSVFSFVKGSTQERSAAGERRQAAETIKTVLTEARELPHFKENEQHIMEKISALRESNPEILRQRGVGWAVNYAYNQVLKDRVFPSLNTSIEAKVRDDMKRVAAGSGGSQHPVSNGSEGSSKVEIKGVDGLSKHMEKLAASMA